MPKRSIKDKKPSRQKNAQEKRKRRWTATKGKEMTKKRSVKEMGSAQPASQRQSVAVAMVENKKAFALCTRERSVF
jgi:hypothetical protein